MLDTNFIAIAVAGVVSLAVATIWYSPLLFGNTWMRSAGIMGGEDEGAGDYARLVVAFLVQCAALTLMTSLLRLSSVFRADGALLGLLKIAVIASLVSASLVIWERKPLSYFLIHGGYLFIALVGGGAIIMYWPW